MPICTQCNRESKTPKEKCFYCGGAMAIETKAQLNCPRCNTHMRREPVDGIELDLCDNCGGTWYDRGELEQHIAAGSSAEAEDAQEQPLQEFQREADKLNTRYLKCPICEGIMTRKNWGRMSGIILDICGPHGLFLDSGELDKVRQFEGSGTKARADRLESWERASGERDRRKKDQEVRRQVQREVIRSRVRWGTWFS